ncbi:aldose epimerase family protein [Paracoccus laeviglucosivorans]|uniref:Aldose 1-epimerase n=1 Tax=Paracoccus laeviglucosivorans TaxID=1197861 RepID=A0A521DJ39_9RHOB|nr:aldose epimerase family protein [Paracoccus laeviglucosivorans]SMO71608.1 aldose 1-epimerase [Paracoccus laeviglucosivorans]
MTAQIFGTLPDGRQVTRVTLQGHGLTASIITLGASLQDLRIDGTEHPLVLGYPTLEPYLTEGVYFGAIVGRYANRIAAGEARIAGRSYQLDRNEQGRTMLHGGADGTGQRNWTIADHGPDHVSLVDHLPDGHMGFPGAMLVRAFYRLMPGPVLRISVLATASDTTLCNFAPHSYFNLDGSDDLSGHLLHIAAQTYLPVDDHLIPVGAPAPVQGSHLDFREPTRLADRLHGPLIDHNLCIGAQNLGSPVPVATLQAANLSMQIETTMPGLQVYAGDHIRPGATGLAGRPYHRFAGIALETQFWPDSPHHPDYPLAELRRGDVYRHITNLRFRPAAGS